MVLHLKHFQPPEMHTSIASSLEMPIAFFAVFNECFGIHEILAHIL